MLMYEISKIIFTFSPICDNIYFRIGSTAQNLLIHTICAALPFRIVLTLPLNASLASISDGVNTSWYDRRSEK